MKLRHIAAAAALAMIAFAMAGCVTETVTNPDGSVKTTKRPDETSVMAGAYLGGKLIDANTKPRVTADK